jgi:hypothetical membrane protein
MKRGFIRAMTDKQQLGGTLIFLAGFLGLLLILVMEALNPTYSVRLDTISELGALSPTILLFGITLVTAGSLALIGALLVRKTLGSRFTGLLCISCLGQIGVGVFPSLHPFKYAPYLHISSAMLIVVFGAIVMLFFYKRFNPPFTYVSIVLGIITLAGGALMFSGLLGTGGMERVMFYPLIVWEVGLGAALMDLHPKLSLRRVKDDF